MRPGDSMTHASVIGSTFDGRIVSETTVGGRPAIVPAIRGSAWITGITQVSSTRATRSRRATSCPTRGRA